MACRHPGAKRLPKSMLLVPMLQVPISIPRHREYWNIQLKAHLKPDSIKSSNTPAWPYQLLVCMSLRKSIFWYNQNSHPPVLVRKPLCNQLIHYCLSSREVFSTSHFKIRNFSVIAIECSFATVDKGRIMARIHRWSVMIYGSLQAEFMETKYNSHIHGYGKLLLIYLIRLTTIIRYFGVCKI